MRSFDFFVDIKNPMNKQLPVIRNIMTLMWHHLSELIIIEVDHIDPWIENQLVKVLSVVYHFAATVLKFCDV